MSEFVINGNIPDFEAEKFYAGEIAVDQGKIKSIRRTGDQTASLPFILPGFIDSHVHIESSMLVPSEFARLAVVHGTVATVSDPHEIANVCGVEGVNFMINNASAVNFKFYFGVPSCVPATIFETAGDEINVEDVESLLRREDMHYLSEMMNFPGVINSDEAVMKKIAIAKKYGKPVDGHAPGVSGDQLTKYVAAGISTDHECFTKEEALEKLSLGMKVIIREGSAAKNFDALIDLLNEYPDDIMFCSDDKHPDSLVSGHINQLCKRALDRKINLFNVIRAACINPVYHYKLNVGLLKENDPADFIVLDELNTFLVNKTFINGELVAENGKTKMRSTEIVPVNRFDCSRIHKKDLNASADKLIIDGTLPVIEALDGQLITNRLSVEPKIEKGAVVTDVGNDVLKIVVVNRYSLSSPAISFIKNFGLKSGAIASSVAHDSHNIIAVGVDDDALATAINLIVDAKGGISCVSPGFQKILPLPVAGLMSADDGYAVADAYTEIDKMAKSLGSSLSAPFMTLSFMALLVIPSLKLSDKGLFDGQHFRFVYGK